VFVQSYILSSCTAFHKIFENMGDPSYLRLYLGDSEGMVLGAAATKGE